ncbi:SusC/RagA family TonB-linked outer membrane protein [Chryseobacterium sp.]|uniref:SusC/RagA family TonB-linked outer membrane protein n=1 Tax=Chryseobacterium sp. TaxID=1871047 RepID=UPI0012A8CEA7|nr:SusC/RagA family TonB-linked outer membrane protein [Chryseobacterium sp.]QFG52226.1 SusC/RagA family TonB-linked outer membrane protein [Chryseobacterium sp.]
MNVKLRVLSAGVLFFIGHTVSAQQQEVDTTQTAEIEEVVVLGYNRTATKPKDVTASTTVSQEKFENRPTTSFLNSLQGESPGLTINAASGQPGSGKIDVIIRGIGSLSAGSEPLYVIDGIISNATQFRNLNDNDIESASVLRDAAATSIYGNRAANGVIVIKTKSGRYNAPMKFSYNASTGMSLLPENKYDLNDAKQALKLEQMAGQGMGADMTDAEIAAYNGVDTNWRKVFFNPGFTQRHDLAMTVGGENMNLYSSLGYMEQTGIVPATSDFKRFTFRNNFNGRSENERFLYGAQVALSYSRRHQLDEETNTAIRNNSVQNPLHGANAGLPYLMSGQYANGIDLYNAIGTDFSGGKNIFALEDVVKGSMPNRRSEIGILTNVNMSYKLTDALTLGNKTGIDWKNSETIFARAPWNYLALAVSMGQGTTALPADQILPGFEDMAKANEFNINNVTSLQYSKVFGEKHTVNAGAYLDYLKVHYNTTSQRRTGLDSRTWVFGNGTGYAAPLYFDNGTGAPITYYVPSASAGKITAGGLAYFATLDYDYDDKYGFSGLVRRDASYRFIDENKWATFWSVAGRWNIDRESFMEGSAFDMLKLRVSYGVQGNQNIIAVASGNNPMLAATNLVREVYVTGNGYNNTPGALGFGGLKNPDTQWEKIYQFNVGLDFVTLNRKLEGNIDVYDKTTKDLYNGINLSAVTGQYGIDGNNGELRNRGVEGLLKYTPIRNQDSKLTFYVNGGYNENRIMNIAVEETSGAIRNVVGGPAFQWHYAPYLGVNPSNGNALFLDANGNPTEILVADVDDRATGKNMFPLWSGGFGFNSEYKGLYLDTHFSFQQGAWKYDNAMAWLYDPTSIGEWNQASDMLDAWSPTNTGGSQPSLNATNLTFADYSDRFLKDASFIRLKNIALGYNLPKRVIEGTFVKSMKVFVQAENLYTWTKWPGYDPEPNFSYSLSVYPNMKTVSLGTNIEF